MTMTKKEMGLIVCALLFGGAISQATLVHYYNFDEGMGTTVNDQIGVNPQNGAFDVGKTPADWTGGQFGGGLQFNGIRGDGNDDTGSSGNDLLPNPGLGSTSRDVVNFGTDSSFDLVSAGTIMYWYRQDPGHTGDLHTNSAITNPFNANWMIVKGGDTDGQGTSYILHNQPSQSLNLRGELVGGPNAQTASNVVPFDGTWVHIAYSWENAGGLGTKIYLNGIEVAGSGGAVNIAVNPNAPFYLGGDPIYTGAGRGFVGAVDELKIFDTFLDEAGVQAAMVLIPEPSIIALLGLGALILAHRLRRRR